MAYINLLPPEDRKYDMGLRRRMILIGIVVYLVILIGIYLVNIYHINQMKSESVSLDEQIKMLEPNLKRVQEMEHARQELESKFEMGQSLDQEFDFYKLLIWLSQQTPSQVTLNQMSYGDRKYAFEGEAHDYEGIATFVAVLKDSEYFSDVELISSFTNMSSESSISFKIRAILKVKG